MSGFVAIEDAAAEAHGVIELAYVGEVGAVGWRLVGDVEGEVLVAEGGDESEAELAFAVAGDIDYAGLCANCLAEGEQGKGNEYFFHGGGVFILFVVFILLIGGDLCIKLLFLIT